jgi:hypothetical protein
MTRIADAYAPIPKKAACPKDTWPHIPARRFQAMDTAPRMIAGMNMLI